MSNLIKIFQDPASGVVYFENSTVNPAPTNVCVATAVDDTTDRILIVRTDKFKRGSTTEYRTLFKRLNFVRIRDEQDNSFATREDAINYLTATFAQAAVTDVNAAYLGVWDAETNNPDITALTPANGDWFYITVSGSIDPNGDGVLTGSTNFRVDDIVKYCSQSNFTGWQYLPNETVRVDELDNTLNGIVTNSSLTQYDIHVDTSYTGLEELGTAIKPYRTIEQAITAASATEVTEILLNGEFTITSPIVIPSNKKIYLYGTAHTTIQYANYSNVGGNLITYSGTNYSGEFVVSNLEFKNAGGFAISVISASKVDIDDCVFENNGWSGNGIDLLNEETGSILGYNSSTGSLQTFYTAECSEGGAIYLGNVGKVEITDNTINNNNKGIEIIDSGFVGTTEAFGFIARNQIYNNISIGIDLESSTGDALAGCRNFTVYNNAVNQNGDSGVKIEGGINNTLSLGVLKGNWNSGIELAHVANTRVRDLDLDNNNRAGVDAEGDESDGLASLQIEGNTIKDGATFIAEIFNVQIHNTNLGSNTTKSGLLIKEEVGNVVGTAAIIKLDNVGFIEQDYGLDIAADLDNLRLVIGDCEYIDTRIKAVRLQSDVGWYSELPYTNFTTDVPYADFTKDTVSKTISILDGQGGKTINTYPINHITAIQRGTDFDIRLTNTNKIQLRGLTEDRVFIDGVAQTGTLSDVVNALNAFFTETQGAAPTPITTPVVNDEGITVTTTTGSRTIDPTGDDEFAGNSSGYNHGYVFANQAIDQGGEYYTFQIRKEGTIGMGFHKSGSTGIYSLDNLGTGTGNGNYGLHWSTWFHPTPNGPWTYYGEASGQTSLRSGWYSFDDSSTGADWLAGENVLMKAGIDNDGHLYLSYYDTTSEDYVVISKKSSAAQEGELYHLVIKFGDQNVRLYDTPKVHLRSEADSGTAPLGDDTVNLFGTATGTLADGIQVTDATGNKSGFVTSASISASGQYFEFTQLEAYSTYVGLSNEDDFSSTFIQTQMNLSSSVPTDRFFYGGGYISEVRNRWQLYGLTDDSGSSSGFIFNSGVGYTQRHNTHFRIGISTDGHITFWQSTNGVNFLEAAKSINTVPSDQTLKFLWKGDDDNAELTSLTSGQLTSTPTLTYFAIESPDGQWHYPLFQTAEEANYFDNYLAVPTGSGTSHTHVYVDDISGTTWYMPENGSAMNTTTHPTGSYLSGSTFNYVATADDSNYAPSAFNQSFSIEEGDTLNLQIVPTDATFTTNVVGLPSWLTYSNGYLTGTAPYVPSDNINLIQVNRTNSYGTTNGTLTLTITDNQAASAIAGGTIISGSNTLAPNVILPNDYDSLIEWDTVLSQGQEMVYTVPSDNPTVLAPTIGILSAIGENTLANYDYSVAPLGTTGNNFALRSQWALRYVTFDGYLGGSDERYQLTGWSDNNFLTNNSPYMLDVELKLEYSTDGYIRLYRNGVLLKTSANTFSGDQTIYFAGYSEHLNNLAIPSNLVIRDSAYTGTAISGWTHLTGSTNLSSSNVLNPDSAVQLDLELRDGERIIFTKEWVEANILPFMDEDEDSTDSSAGEQSVYIGVLRDSADVTDGITHSDFEVAFEWLNNDATRASNNHRLRTIGSGIQYANVGIGSKTNALYDFAFDNRGGTVEALATLSTNNNVGTELRLAEGGIWQQSNTNSTFAAGETVSIVIGTRYGGASISNTGVSRINSPLTNNEFNVTEDTFSLPLLTGPSVTGAVTPASITLNAGQTYKFYMDNSSIEAADILDFVLTSDSSVYTTGVTSVGTPGTAGAYVEFAIPQDVPPISLRWRSGGVGSGTNYGLTIAGSTYSVEVAGIDLEGPSSNQTGTNIADNGNYGWASVDETLDAGQRFVMNNAFFTDLLAEMGDQYEIRIGLKGDNWDNGDQSTESNSAITGEVFKGDLQLRIYKSSSNNIYFQLFKPGTSYNQMLINTVTLHNSMCAFIEITSSGNNIRMGFGRNGNLDVSQGDESTVIYSDWSAYKGQTGDQGFGITSLDVMFLVTDIYNGNNDDYDGANVDWTNLSEISTPVAPTNATSWTKALDFSGSSQRAQQATNTVVYCPLMMGNIATTTTIPADPTVTVNDSNARPWATAIVFQADRNSSNQHIWNQGEGAGSIDDNIYLRLDSNGQVYFGWGRQGALNECKVVGIPHYSTGRYWGVYIAHNGTRLNGSNATAANLADAFDIRVMTNNGGDNFTTLGSNQSTSANWTSTGGRMDRSIGGSFTIGGRGSNRNFHGKVASMVVTTLMLNTAMPSDAEIAKMITDPVSWVDDYKVGNEYRVVNSTQNYQNFRRITGHGSGTLIAGATQVWLMGDGASDSYSNMIRNYIQPLDQNYTRLNMISMVSNDIETVTISGLS